MSADNSETMTLDDADVEKRAQAQALPKDSEDAADGSTADSYQVQLEPEDDPKSLSAWHKWLAVLVISSSSLCATFASSVVCSLSHRVLARRSRKIHADRGVGLFH